MDTLKEKLNKRLEKFLEPSFIEQRKKAYFEALEQKLFQAADSGYRYIYVVLSDPNKTSVQRADELIWIHEFCDKHGLDYTRHIKVCTKLSGEATCYVGDIEWIAFTIYFGWETTHSRVAAVLNEQPYGTNVSNFRLRADPLPLSSSVSTASSANLKTKS